MVPAVSPKAVVEEQDSDRVADGEFARAVTGPERGRGSSCAGHVTMEADRRVPYWCRSASLDNHWCYGGASSSLDAVTTRRFEL